MPTNSIITGTGSYLPKRKIKKRYFSAHSFLDRSGYPVSDSNEKIAKKIQDLTGIQERRYLEDHEDAVSIARKASEKAIQDSGIDKEQINAIIFAHNFGNIAFGENHPRQLPNLSAQLKNQLEIKNHKCIALDIIFGCPGWLQAVMQAHYMLQSGIHQSILVVGAESMSRVIDPHDLKSLLFGDGAGALILQTKASKQKAGIIGSLSYSHTEKELDFLNMGKSFDQSGEKVYVKMRGKKVFRYTIQTLPELILETLDKLKIPIEKVSKFLFHQTNERIIKSISETIFKRSGIENPDFQNLIPMTVRDLGNISVATVPTLLDLILKKQMKAHRINPGDIVVMASVGGGMHATCLVYQFPD